MMSAPSETTNGFVVASTKMLMGVALVMSAVSMIGSEVQARTSGMNASWYGPGFHGRRTASGEIFNTGAYTAAHRSLPFGTKVRVVNVTTGRSVIVRINDRGSFIRGRIIDLSKAAAQAIGMTGTARVALARA